MKKILISVLLFCSFLVWIQWNQRADLQATMALKIDSSVSLSRLVLVKMASQADLTGVGLLKTKADKNQFVYDQLSQHAQRTQANLLSLLNDEGFKYRSYYIVNMVAVFDPSQELITTLAGREDVSRLYGDIDLPQIDPAPAPLMSDLLSPTGVGPNVAAVGADRVWNEFGVRGANIVVAGQDTGIDWDHPALVKQYRGSSAGGNVDHNYHWHDAIKTPIGGGSSCPYDSPEPCDDNAHGTHTIGTVVGDDGVGNQIGVAPDSTWIGCRNMDAGVGRPTTYMACFEFFLAPYPLKGSPLKDGDPNLAPHVVNNSWGCPSSEKCHGDVLLEILRNLKAAGIFVVVSAGNDGPKCSTIKDTPAWHTVDSFSVGAINHRSGKIAGFSSRGPSTFDGGVGPDIVAPGVSIRSATPGGSFEEFWWSGTSMAGPHVVGVAALMWSAQPKLVGDVDTTIEILRATATPVPSATCMSDGKEQVPNNTYGYGAVNAYEAVKMALDL